VTTPDRPLITDAPERGRYEATVGDRLAGILEYVIKHGRIALIHSEVSPAHRGRGVAAALARFALDDARRRELKVIVNCPYVQDYVRRHPADDDIIIGRAGTTPT
jgi:uncharacterized protein